MCDQRARMLQDQFRVSVNHVHALGVLASTFHYYKNPSVIDQVGTLLMCVCLSFFFFLWLNLFFFFRIQETFAEYTARTTFERPLLSGVAYAQRVMNYERDDLQRQHDGTIRTMTKEPSPFRDEYAPVIFAQETVSFLNW